MKALASPLPSSPSRAASSPSPRASAPTGPTPPPLPDPPISSGLSADRIRARAHEIYNERLASGRQGDAASDWLQAEQQLLARDPSSSSEIEARARVRGETLLANPT